jgi:hypothetical protein
VYTTAYDAFRPGHKQKRGEIRHKSVLRRAAATRAGVGKNARPEAGPKSIEARKSNVQMVDGAILRILWAYGDWRSATFHRLGSYI